MQDYFCRTALAVREHGRAGPTLKLAVPHAPGDGLAVRDVAALGQRLVERHAKQHDAVVEGADEEVDLLLGAKVVAVVLERPQPHLVGELGEAPATVMG